MAKDYTPRMFDAAAKVENFIERHDHSDHEGTNEEGRPVCNHPSHNHRRPWAPCDETRMARAVREEVLDG